MSRLSFLLGWGIGSLVAIALTVLPCPAAQTYAAQGLVLRVDLERNELVVSMSEIPGVMDAMVMLVPVRRARELGGVQPGMIVDFTWMVTGETSYAENLHVRRFENLENDPLAAGRLAVVQQAMNPSHQPALAVGQRVPEFSLSDQNQQCVSLSQFAGRVVAMTFVYTRCPFPNFCFRLSNNFGQLQKRFNKRMGTDLVLLTVTLDPAVDQPNALAKYAGIWKANAAHWRFLTGSAAEVSKVTSMFGVAFIADEAMVTHPLHTVIIDRRGNLVANLEGNEFTAQQLGDFVEETMNRVSGVGLFREGR
jgi:protein SCO1/2